ncbi:Sister chromatid cohesion protein 2 [Tulasnella sp. 419]|nr:Sister chromatid cohesion protein 2 [Tulasnella sp. 419]
MAQWNNGYSNDHNGYNHYNNNERTNGQQHLPIQPHQQHELATTGPVPGIHRSEEIMSMYPFASVTPVQHVSRHLDYPAPPAPSYIHPPQPHNISSSSYDSSYHQGGYRYSQFGEYAEPIAQLTAPTVPPSGTQQRQHWDYHQRQATSLLAQPSHAYSHSGYSHPQSQNHVSSQHSSHAPHRQSQPSQYHYSHQQHQHQHQQLNAPSQPQQSASSWAPSGFQPNAFASSLLSSNQYSYPPPMTLPPGVSTNRTPSSLSMALGDPAEHRSAPRHHNLPPKPQVSMTHQLPAPPPPARREHTAAESRDFFNGYLENVTKDIEALKTGPAKKSTVAVVIPTPPRHSLPPRPMQSQEVKPAPHKQQPPPQPSMPSSHSVPIFPSRTKTPPLSSSRSGGLYGSKLQPDESPDPLALGDLTTAVRPSFTPRKRKPEEMLASPTVKRLQSVDSNTSSRPSSSTTRTPGSVKFDCVEIPSHPVHKNSPTKGPGSGPTLGKEFYRNRMGSEVSDVTRDGNAPSDDELALGSAMRSERGKGTGPRTGDRDDRGPLEKLQTLLDDIFEAEDSIPADTDSTTVDEDQFFQFFSRLTTDYTRPLLSSAIMAKLTKAIGVVARPMKRIRLQTGKIGPTPRRAGLTELDPQILSRILKMLGRSARLGEDLDPFAGPPVSMSVLTVEVASPTKSGKGKKKAAGTKKNAGGKGAAKGVEGEEPVEHENQEDTTNSLDVTEEQWEKMSKELEMAKESAIAADCCLALLSADKLSKQLYSEELITSCLASIKNQLTKVVYPFAEVNSDLHGQASALLIHIVRDNDHVAQSGRKVIGEIFQSLCAVFPRINTSLGRTDLAMSDSIVIQAVYIAIGPFFVVDLGTENKATKERAALVLEALGGPSALRGLRLSALSLIRTIFAHYKDQRSWIIEEILSSLIQAPDLKQKSGQFRLRDGRSIHTVSALLLQLVQTSAHDVRVEGIRFHKARMQLMTQASQLNISESQGKLLSDTDQEEIRMYNSCLDSANSAAKSIIAFLTMRSGKGKITKNTKEADYRAIFDNLLSDLLTVLYWPEWPAAALVLGIVTKYLVSVLDDVKTSTNVDTNGAKSIALDHLGIIAARLRTTWLRAKTLKDSMEGPFVSMDEIVASIDLAQLERLIAAHEDVSGHLMKRSSEDQAYDSAQELTAASWGQELARALMRCDSLLSKMSEAEEDSPDYQELWKLAVRLQSTLRDVWKQSHADVFDVGNDEEVARLDALADELGASNRLTSAVDVIMNAVLNSLEAPAVFVRTKGLRALGQILLADPDALRNSNVRRAIEHRLFDQSPAVRDAAVDLIGKYVVQLPDLANDYYDVIATRIVDTGLGVRKRIIKLLRTLYSMFESDGSRQVDICTKLVSRMSDEDDTVKELAMKTLEELWFGEATLPSNPKNTQRIRVSAGPEESKEEQVENRARSTAFVIMSVAGNFGDRHSPVEDLLHQVVASKEGSQAKSTVLERYKETLDALINSLVDGQSYPGFNLVSCIKTVHLLVAAHPAMMTTAHAKSLLPYLKNTTNKEDQMIADYILKVYCACIPQLPKTASQFAQELQSTLASRIQKPPTIATLQDCIACFCTVVQHLTQDLARLTGLLKSCNARVRKLTSQPETVVGPVQRALIIVIWMLVLLCENCDFDRLRNEKPASIRAPVLRCLGTLFKAQPTLMTRSTSADIMDAIFESPEEESRGRVLKIMQDFLVSESDKHTTLQRGEKPNTNDYHQAHGKFSANQGKTSTKKNVNMEELVGNTGGFAESGVSSAIVQRYLVQILEACLSRHPQIQASAVEIVAFTIKQGLAHPLQCRPVLVALETSPNNSLSNKASGLHAILYNKHSSLVNSRYLESTQKSFEYQCTISPEGVKGFRPDPVPTALLHHWYSLVREKRPARQDFLKAVVKCFDLDTTHINTTQTEVDYRRYMAENMSALDYRTQEEVLTVIKHLTSVLSVAGMHIMAAFSSSLSQAGQPNGIANNIVNCDNPAETSAPSSHSPPSDEDELAMARASVVMGMILVLKTHLKNLYGLSEDKCSKWIPGKKSTIGDKAVVKRKPDLTLSWERMPYAVKPILLKDDIIQQKQTVE